MKDDAALCIISRYVVVNYDQTLEEMIGRGRYDAVDCHINSNIFKMESSNGKQKKELHLFHFGRKISFNEADSEMTARGYHPANIENLLALGEDDPELQKSIFVVALGSVREISKGHLCVPGLGNSRCGRTLLLYDIDFIARNSVYFLAVKK